MKVSVPFTLDKIECQFQAILFRKIKRDMEKINKSFRGMDVQLPYVLARSGPVPPLR